MRQFLKRNTKRHIHGSGPLDDLLDLPIETASEIKDLFLAVSSLKEISLQHQAKRRILRMDAKKTL